MFPENSDDVDSDDSSKSRQNRSRLQTTAACSYVHEYLPRPDEQLGVRGEVEVLLLYDLVLHLQHVSDSSRSGEQSISSIWHTVSSWVWRVLDPPSGTEPFP